MDAVRGRHAAVLETEPAQQGGGFDDVLDGFNDEARFGRDLRLQGLALEHLVAMPRDREPGLRGRKAASNVVHRAGFKIRAGLEPGPQGVLDAGHEEADRGCDDHGRIDHDEVGAARQVVGLLEDPVIRVDHDDGAGRGVRRGDGRDDADAGLVAEGDHLGRVDGCAAAHAYHDVMAALLHQRAHLSDLAFAALAAEMIEGGGGVRPKTVANLAFQRVEQDPVDEKEGRLAQHAQVFIEPGHLPDMLNVTASSAEGTRHAVGSPDGDPLPRVGHVAWHDWGRLRCNPPPLFSKRAVGIVELVDVIAADTGGLREDDGLVVRGLLLTGGDGERETEAVARRQRRRVQTC